MKIVEQLPDFKEFATEIFQHIQDNYNSALEANKDSNKYAMEAYRILLDDLRELIKAETTSPEEKQFFLEKAMELADRISAKDSENKSFIHSIFKTVGYSLAIVAGVALALLVAKPSDEETIDDDINID